MGETNGKTALRSGMADFQFANIPTVKSVAEYAKDALVSRIQAFQARLGEDEEMTILVGGVPIAFRVYSIGFASSFIVFYGADADGRRAESYQNIAQANVTLLATAKVENEAPRRIGFETASS